MWVQGTGCRILEMKEQRKQIRNPKHGIKIEEFKNLGIAN